MCQGSGFDRTNALGLLLNFSSSKNESVQSDQRRDDRMREAGNRKWRAGALQYSILCCEEFPK